jgi:hypothetical protein
MRRTSPTSTAWKVHPLLAVCKPVAEDAPPSRTAVAVVAAADLVRVADRGKPKLSTMQEVRAFRPGFLLFVQVFLGALVC